MESLAQLTGLFSLPALLLAAAIILAGFLMYCSLSAIGGSLAGKAEDLGTTNVLFSMVLVASFLACIIAGGMDGSARKGRPSARWCWCAPWPSRGSRGGSTA